MSAAMLSERFSLAGKVVLVVGGRGYLGRRIGDEFARAGARVHSADVAEASRTAAAEGRPPLGSVDVVQHSVDVTRPEAVAGLVDAVRTREGRIDVLVYSVTTKPRDFYLPFTECSLEGWQNVIGTELDGAFLVTQQVGAQMQEQRAGSVILLSSIYGVVGNDQRIYEGANLHELYAGSDKQATRMYSHISYAAAKGAIISMTRYLAAYWGEYGIRVNAVSPGGVYHPGENESFVAKYSYRVPLGRKAHPEEIVDGVAFLASDASAYINGQNLIIDGGWTAW